MLLTHLDEGGVCIGIDRDADNIAIACENLSDFSSHRAIHSSFSDIDIILNDNSIDALDFILYDLGVSSAHYDDGNRGFSLRFDAPLDMRFDRTKWKTAKELIMTATEDELKNIFFRYADEKKAIFIARALVEARKSQEINTTFDLLNIIKGASFDKKSPLRVFQALRIAVNAEFDHIIHSLESVIHRMRPGWKIAIISFHSIEDRLIKQFFAPLLQNEIDDLTGQTRVKAPYKKSYKKPIIPTAAEMKANPRARSAKLRVYEKIS